MMLLNTQAQASSECYMNVCAITQNAMLPEGVCKCYMYIHLYMGTNTLRQYSICIKSSTRFAYPCNECPRMSTLDVDFSYIGGDLENKYHDIIRLAWQ